MHLHLWKESFAYFTTSTELKYAENYTVMYIKKILQVSDLDSGLILSTHKSHFPIAVKFDEPAYSKQLLHTAFDSYLVSFKINS